MCFIYVFFVLQLLELSMFDLTSVFIRLLVLLSVSPWALTPATSVTVFWRSESACSSSHHTEFLVYYFFWFLPDVPHPDVTFYPPYLKLPFALPYLGQILFEHLVHFPHWAHSYILWFWCPSLHHLSLQIITQSNFSCQFWRQKKTLHLHMYYYC